LIAPPTRSGVHGLELRRAVAIDAVEDAKIAETRRRDGLSTSRSMRSA
jgi:hypothetical protein